MLETLSKRVPSCEMSDYEYDPDEEMDYNDGDSSGCDEDGPDVRMENMYYEGKTQKESDSSAALSCFRQVLQIEEEEMQEKCEWGFKALKQMMKIHFKLVRFCLFAQRGRGG